MGTAHGETTGFTLKVAAIAGMTCNHAAYVFGPLLPDPVTVFLLSCGGLTFPIMAFLLTEGFAHTSSRKRYLKRLLVFAAIAQLPYSLLWGVQGNVLFTLALSLWVLAEYERGDRSVRFILVLGAALLLSSICDWAVIGPVTVLLMQIGRKNGTMGVFKALALPCVAGLISAVSAIAASDPSAALATTAGCFSHLPGYALLTDNPNVALAGEIGYSLFCFVGAGSLISLYRGRRGRPLKWFFYLYYPAHLLAIWAIAMAVYGY